MEQEHIRIWKIWLKFDGSERRKQERTLTLYNGIQMSN